MNLSELKQYPHKIVKIDVTNKNNTDESYYDTAMLKVTIPEKKDNEIVIFSYDKELTEEIPRTQNNDDYFLTINNIKGVTVIYAHFLISDLYDSTEEEENDDNFVSYDLKKLKQYTSDTYYVSDDEHPQISSILEGSIRKNKEKDPNYKQYNIDENEKKIKGRFPIASRYSNLNKKIVPPNIEQTPTATFKRENYQQNENAPEWEAYIPRTDIGDLIPPDTNTNQYPINVYLNYEYLPTTTEYHQHFYGFEAKNNYTDALEKCRQINVFEGDNLETINNAFFDNDEKYTYRLINWGNKADHTRATFVDHSNIIPINILDPIINNDSCDWEKNNCENYYIYTALTDDANRGLYYPIELKPNTSYTLKYYVYIPNDIKDNELDCYMEMQSANEANETTQSNVIVIGTLNEVFKKQDKFLTNQWVYHEIPFRTTQKHNRIYIKGHKDINKSVYFANVYIEEFVQYSPTIKYTDKGVFVIEGKDSIEKPNSDYNKKECLSINTNQIHPKLAPITEPKIPYNSIDIEFDENFDVEYNNRTKILSCFSNGGYDIVYEKGAEEWNLYLSQDGSIEDDEAVSFTIEDTVETITVIEDNIEKEKTIEHKYLCLDYIPKQIFTYGTNNKFALKILSDYQQGIQEGYVECFITTGDDENAEIVKNLGKKYADAEKNIKYSRLDFSKIPKNNKYFLRIDYYHPCYDKVMHIFKKIFFTEEDLEMSITVNGQTIENHNTISIHHINEFPLKIIVNVHQTHDMTQGTDWGYCELSIDDEVQQVAYVDANGIADFYLNKNTDNIQQSQTIKIEYYRKYNEVIEYDYFTLVLDQDFEGRDAVPIRFNILSNNYIEQMDIDNTDDIDIVLQKNDCLLIDIDTDTTKGNDETINRYSTKNQYINYSIRLYKTENNTKEYITFSNEKTYVNITSSNNDSIVIGCSYIDDNNFTRKTVQYTIVTDSLIKNTDDMADTITYQNNKYRQYSKSITVTWEEA